MKRLRIMLPLILVFTFPHLAFAQQQISLRCKGDIETTTETTKDNDPVRKPVTVDVLLDLQDSTVEINGYWGCLADIGNNNPFSYKCVGKMPVNVSYAEVKFSARSSDDKYEGSTVFTINRYSGSLSISSHAISKPAANAQWGLLLISAKLQCTKPEKKF